MIIGSTKEDLSLEKRVALTPESAKNIIGLGLKVCIEKNLANHILKDIEQKSSTNNDSSTENLLNKFFDSI